MKNCFGVVAEFNPFHNGHAALADFARESGATHVAAVMSGNAVQRGSFAVCDKRTRTRAALSSGIDLVLELPLPYAVSGARSFAAGAIHILKSAGCVDALCFGSESGDIKALENLSRIVDDRDTQKLAQSRMKAGTTYAKARGEAISALFGAEAAGAVSSPNNILATEYLRAMRILGWEKPAFTMRRAGISHDSRSPSGGYASASYLRSISGDMDALRPYVPATAMEVYREAEENGLFPADESRLENAMISYFRRLGLAELKSLPDISEGLENRIHSSIGTASTLEGLLMGIKSKRYTLARVRRLLLCAFLGVREGDLSVPPPYIHVLGFNKKGGELLKAMKQECPLSVHTSLARLEKISPACARFAELETGCTDQLSLLLPAPPPRGYEYSASAVILKT